MAFETETLHIIAPYFNPHRYESRRRLCLDFIRHMEAYPNVELHIVDAAFGDRPHEMARHGKNDVRLRTSHVLWLKENMINVGVQHLPHDWKYAGYIDADFHYTRQDWVVETIHQLQHNPWVQMYSSYSPLGPNHLPTQIRPSFAFAYHNYFGGKPATVIVPGKTSSSTAANPLKAAAANHYCAAAQYPEPLPITQTTVSASTIRNTTPGATGGAWAWTREGFNAVGGLLDTCVLGAADWYMSFGMVGNQVDGHPEAVSCGLPYENSIRRWQDRAFRAIKGRIGYVDNFATHHWHGDLKNRGYGTRWQILRDHGFDPSADIGRDWQGLIQWAGNKPALEADVNRYFLSRNEDSTEFFGKTMV